MTTLTDKINSLPEARRKKIEKRAQMLIGEEMSLRDLRKALRRTQSRVASDLGINQENVSRIERRTDLLISTLSGYVEAMGGKLHLVAEFPDRPPVTLTGIGALADKDASPEQ
ncbi:MAG: XRE family transcriptional regulator [Chloroflexi bacterium]|nr:XRE family transcriptional regulator [Chloroflexota bacterium]